MRKAWRRKYFNPSGPVLPLPCLMLVTDRRLAGGEERLTEAVARAVEAGVNVVQMREKDLPLEDVLPLARRLREATRGRAMLLVNGPLEVAREVGADGVHVPERVEPPEAPWTYIWGRSVHSLEGAVRAVSEAARYIVAGPVFETRSHPRRRRAGVDFIRELAGVSLVPVIGIGGITPHNASGVIRAGADGIAVISAILGEPSPGAAARALREAVDTAYAGENGERA